MSIAIATIDDATVTALIAAASAFALGRNKPMSICICDHGANLKAFHRMDGASLIGSKVCQDKAWSSAASRRPTHVNYERIKDDPPLLAGMPHQPHLIVFGGGYPVVIDGEFVGAIGISGGGHWEKDMDCALAALKAVGAKTDW
jgi:uncharacterized protein GlcG (DUF336 family)